MRVWPTDLTLGLRLSPKPGPTPQTTLDIRIPASSQARPIARSHGFTPTPAPDLQLERQTTAAGALSSVIHSRYHITDTRANCGRVESPIAVWLFHWCKSFLEPLVFLFQHLGNRFRSIFQNSDPPNGHRWTH